MPSCWMRLIKPQSFRRMSGSSPTVGSSRKRMRGLCNKARASMIRRFSPPESVFVSTSTLCAISTVSSKLVIPSFLSDAFMPKSRPWMSRFSRTESSASQIEMLAHDAAQCLGFQRVFGEVTPGKFDGAAVCPGLTGQDTYGRCLSGSISVQDRPQVPDPSHAGLCRTGCGFGQMIW